MHCKPKCLTLGTATADGAGIGSRAGMGQGYSMGRTPGDAHRLRGLVELFVRHMLAADARSKLQPRIRRRPAVAKRVAHWAGQVPADGRGRTIRRG